MPAPERQEDFPWWLAALVAAGLWLFVQVWQSDVYAQIMAKLFDQLHEQVLHPAAPDLSIDLDAPDAP